MRRVLHAHLDELHAFYGEFLGVRVARKHVSWYTARLEGGTQFRHAFNKLENAQAQSDALDTYFRRLELGGYGLAADAREELAA